jgi:hypothetical protein
VGGYAPSWVDMAFLLGSFGWFFMWFLLFIKQMPVFALAEIKEIVPPQMRGRAGTADEAMEHGGMANPLTSGGPHTTGGDPLMQGVIGTFRELDSAVHAIEDLKRRKLGDMTVYSPAPRHELEHAIHAPQSGVRKFTLIGGLLGVTFGYWVAIWTSEYWPSWSAGRRSARGSRTPSSASR